MGIRQHRQTLRQPHQRLHPQRPLHTLGLQAGKMAKKYRGDTTWWFNATLFEDHYHYTNTTGLRPVFIPRMRDSGFRLARTQQVLENAEGREWERR